MTVLTLQQLPPVVVNHPVTPQADERKIVRIRRPAVFPEHDMVHLAPPCRCLAHHTAPITGDHRCPLTAVAKRTSRPIANGTPASSTITGLNAASHVNN